MTIHAGELDKLAALAHLELTAKERAAVGRDLNAIIGFVDRIKAQEDPVGSPPVTGQFLPLAVDAVRPSLPKNTAVGSAPTHTDEAIIAPPLEPAA